MFICWLHTFTYCTETTTNCFVYLHVWCPSLSYVNSNVHSYTCWDKYSLCKYRPKSESQKFSEVGNLPWDSNRVTRACLSLQIYDNFHSIKICWCHWSISLIYSLLCEQEMFLMQSQYLLNYRLLTFFLCNSLSCHLPIHWRWFFGGSLNRS